MMTTLCPGKIHLLFLYIEIIVYFNDFHTSPTQDSPKKARVKEHSTPSKISGSARQLVFDTAVYVVLVA